MTTTTFKSMLKAAVFTGAIAVLPAAALAAMDGAPGGDDATEQVPDHEAAEAGSMGGATGASGEGTLDHAAAEARNASNTAGSSAAAGAAPDERVPDHAAAEARSAADETHE